MTNPIAIYGAGDLGREVLMLIHQINHSFSGQWQPLGFFDDGVEAGTSVNNLPVLGGLSALNAYPTPIAVVIAISGPETKKKIIGQIQNSNIAYPTLIHPHVQLLPQQQVSIGEGSIICAGTIITVDAQIGRHVLLNLNTTVGHDAIVGDYSSLMPAVNVSGKVTLGEGVFAGTSSSFKQQITVGDYVTIGMGAAVINSLPDHCTAVGVPAVIRDSYPKP